MAGAAEEAAEEVEGVVPLATAAAGVLLTVLGDTLVTVLVVDAASGRVGEGVVGVGDGDEFLLGSFVAAVSS